MPTTNPDLYTMPAKKYTGTAAEALLQAQILLEFEVGEGLPYATDNRYLWAALYLVQFARSPATADTVADFHEVVNTAVQAVRDCPL